METLVVACVLAPLLLLVFAAICFVLGFETTTEIALGATVVSAISGAAFIAVALIILYV